jgi:hypothetical protein
MKKKKRNKVNNKGRNNRDATKVSQEAATLDLSRLLAVSITTKKSFYHLAPGRSEESAWHPKTSTGRSRRGSVIVQGMQGTRSRMNQTPPQNFLTREAMMQNPSLLVGHADRRASSNPTPRQRAQVVLL